jgi:hypothetical protein
MNSDRTILPLSSVRRTLTPFSINGAASLNLAPCGGDWAALAESGYASRGATSWSPAAEGFRFWWQWSMSIGFCETNE